METSAMHPGRSGWFAALAVAAVTVATLAIPAGMPAIAGELQPALKLAQLRAYSASGTHQCGSEKGRSCVVTGSGYSSCNDATTTLQTRDCCPTTPAGGKSSGFVLNYCLSDRP